jgi:hypothetical protein
LIETYLRRGLKLPHPVPLPCPIQTDETARALKSLSARMERWELEGKPIYRNPQNADSRGFRKPNNNVPQVFPREQRSRDRDDQRIQTPLQNNLVSHEEGEEIDELDPEIHCIEDSSSFSPFDSVCI